MNWFYTFEDGEEKINFFNNLNHYIMLFVSLIVIIFFTMYYERKSRKKQRIFVGFLTFFLICLEAARLYWRYLYLDYNSLPINFLSVTGIDFFQLCMYISIPLLIAAVVTMGKKDYTFGLSFIFAMGALSGIITLIYPINLNIYQELYHAYNLIYVFERTTLITAGFILAISRNIAATEFLDLWGGLLSIATFGGVAMLLSWLLGWSKNLFYMASCPIFESAGVSLPFPLHIVMMGVFLFIFQLIMYLPFRLYEVWRNKAIMAGKYHARNK